MAMADTVTAVMMMARTGEMVTAAVVMPTE